MAKTVGYTNIFISDRPRHLKQSCYSRTAVKANWSLERFSLALEGRIPIWETVKDKIKRTAKFLLRESGYNFVRAIIIKVIK